MRLTTVLVSWCLRKKIRMNEKEIRTVNISTTSTGEDLLLADYFSGRTGHYLEIGCNHPRLYNLTYVLYERGWSGVCVDPNPSFASEFQKKRPRDLFLNRAVGDSSVSFNYHQYTYDQLNHLTTAGEPPRPQGLSTLIRTTPIAALGWKELMDQTEAMPGAIDLLLIDAECQSAELLLAAPIPDRLNPKVIVVEAPTEPEVDRCRRKLESLGYRMHVRVLKSGNLFFFLEA